MAGMSATAKNALLNGLVGAGHYISLHSGDPGTTGANEASGGSYARQSITWPSPSGGSVTYSTAIVIPANAGTYTYWGIWSASSGGTWITGGLLSKAAVLAAAGNVKIAVTTLTAGP